MARRNRLQEGEFAPDFAAQTFAGKTVRLADYRGHSNVLLVFLRGFL